MSPFERPTDASEPGNSPTGRATGRPEQATPISAGQGALGAEYGHERLSLFASSSRGSTLGPAPGARNPRVTLQRSQTDRRRGAGSQGLRELLGRFGEVIEVTVPIEAVPGNQVQVKLPKKEAR